MKRSIIGIHLADHKSGHVVHEELMKMVVANGDEDIGLCLNELLAHHVDSLQHLIASGWPVGLLEQPRHEGIVSDAYDRNDFGHGVTSSSVRLTLPLPIFP